MFQDQSYNDVFQLFFTNGKPMNFPTSFLVDSCREQRVRTTPLTKLFTDHNTNEYMKSTLNFGLSKSTRLE
jgi:hypothetical protein